LLAERKKFETWLAQLDTRRESTAEHVFSRVHADYTKRLEQVRERLGAEADGIKALVADLEKRLGKEQHLVTEKTDERAELELRATVGEFSEKEWNSTKAKLDSAIAEIQTKFDGTERELAEMRATLLSVTAPPHSVESADRSPVNPPSPETRPVVVEPAVAKPAPEAFKAKGEAPAPEATKTKVDAAAPRARTPFDELAFLKSVAGVPTTPTPMAAVPSPVPEIEPAPEPESVTPAAAVTPDDVVAEPEMVVDAFVEAVVEPDPHAAYDMTHAPVFEAEPELEPEVEADPESTGARARASSKVSAEPSALGAPTPRTSQAIRSLKCQECGTLNFPTEWYCERCGGELAAF